MAWTVRFTAPAEHDLARCDSITAQRILNKLKWLSIHIRDLALLPLKGRWKGQCKLVVGDWRVIYRVDHPTSTLWVQVIGHRREIYR